jgi:hypothetical protein
VEQAGKYVTKLTLLIEKTYTTYANSIVAPLSQTTDDIRCVEDKRCFCRGLATRKIYGEQARMWTGSYRSWQETSEEGVVGRVSETSGRVPWLPASVR